MGKENLEKNIWAKNENDSWINQEIYNKFKSPESVTVIKLCRVEWLGHVEKWMV